MDSLTAGAPYRAPLRCRQFAANNSSPPPACTERHRAGRRRGGRRTNGTAAAARPRRRPSAFPSRQGQKDMKPGGCGRRRVAGPSVSTRGGRVPHRPFNASLRVSPPGGDSHDAQVALYAAPGKEVSMARPSAHVPGENRGHLTPGRIAEPSPCGDTSAARVQTYVSDIPLDSRGHWGFAGATYKNGRFIINTAMRPPRTG